VADAQDLEDRIGRLAFEWNRPDAAFDQGVLDHVGCRAGALDPAFSCRQQTHVVREGALREQAQLLGQQRCLALG
jgi:hypothetical protein